MTPARSLLIAMVAAVLLIEARPDAEQFPRGLLAGAPGARAPGEPNCTIETRSLSFGHYDPEANANVDAVGQVIYTCNNQAKKIRIEMTTGNAGAFDRRMTAGTGADFLNYNIYLDATRQTVWGQGLFGTDVYYESNPPNGTPVIVPAYGRIPARQSPSPGQYADLVNVRVLF